MTAPADLVVESLAPHARRLGIIDCDCEFDTGKITFKVGAQSFEFTGMGQARMALRLADALYADKLLRATLCQA